MARREAENCVQIVADTVLVDGIAVAVLLTETSPSHIIDAFRRCVDNESFSKAVFRERDAHRVRAA